MLGGDAGPARRLAILAPASFTATLEGPMADDPLEELIHSAADGNKAAFAALVRQSEAKLYAVCLRILHDRQEAEDALQDAYVKIWRYAERYSASRAAPMTWMVAITRNLAIDRLRARRPEGAALDAAENVADTAARADRKLMATDAAKKLAACIEELGPERARIVRIAYFGGATYAALAEREGVPLGTLKSRMRQTLAALRECLLS